MSVRPNRLKQRLRSGQPALGCISVLPSADVAEILAVAGYDFIFIDHEHGYGGLGDAVAQLRAAEAAGATGLVRVPNHDPDYIRRVLDAGAQCLYCPMVETAEQAQAVVRACRYPPDGERGAGGGTRAALFGLGPDEPEALAEELLIVLAIETRLGVDNAKAIAAVPGVDAVFIGPRDLSASLGRLGRFDDPELLALIDRCETAVLDAGRFLGAPLLKGLTGEAMAQRGYRMILVGSDSGLLGTAAREAVAAHRPQ